MARVVLSCRGSNPQERPNARELFDLLINADGGNCRPPFRALSAASSFPSEQGSGSVDLPESASENKSSPHLGRARLGLQPGVQPKSGSLSAPTSGTLLRISETGTDSDAPALTTPASVAQGDLH